MAAGDERLLVGRRDDLARLQRGDDGPQADDTARADYDEVDVRAGRQRRQCIVTTEQFRSSRQIEARVGRIVGYHDDRGP